MDETEIEKLYNGRLSDLYYLYSHASSEEIIKWMRNRKTAEMRIYEIEGDSDVVVVIPTANVNGKLARNVKEVYKGFHIIFVESFGPLFNYARSANFGLKYSLRLKPRWIIISNDDVISVKGDVKNELSVVSRNVDLVMASKSNYHTYPVVLVKPNEYFIKGMKVFGKVFNSAPAEVYGKILRYKERFEVDVITMIKSMVGFMVKFSGEIVGEFINAGSFAIVRPKEKVMDETFINSHEDLLLSITSKYYISNVKVREMRGASLGFGKLRFAKIFVNEIYFNYLIRTGVLKLNDK
ncbi:MAG: hypothetical protein QXY87_09970 [Saccharolobus sp.]|uniref:Glycosyltransferase n=2 Tax=Saccharolobus shibatae TaxID=2286 RepID=A0A8F5BQ22_SACSH|nr:hypothetical protein [Saccharolobus shibatae]MCH4814727.1 hypothetical protein [Saccharolobus shibatae]QXJ29216.1 Uncharacterized protein J5U23_02085 [Saccharolobus shibatae B12]QXJ32460.1 Uncharacterized protein J5U21_02111 [Saccharolobus shibatae]